MGCGESKADPLLESGNTVLSISATPVEPVNEPLPAQLRKSVKEGGFSRDQFILQKSGKITEKYKLMNSDKLGEGSFGTVTKAIHRTFKIECAVKVVGKVKLKDVARFRQEIQIMRRLDHPNIIKLHETYEDQKNIYLVMEMATGGELFDRIVNQGKFTEVEAACVIKQVLRAVYYMHTSNVAHRDLKPENFLFMTKDPIQKTTLKIIDFGLSIPFSKGQVLRTKAGTPYYVAPQVLQGAYDEKSDLWSVGVIMYVLLCGYPPFFANNDNAVLEKVRAGEFSFLPKDWKNVSDDAKKLIRGLLKMNPVERHTAERALHDPWVAKQAPNASKEPLTQAIVDNLKTFRANNKLKKAALQIIAGEMDDSKIKHLREVFTSMDANGNGVVSRSELRDALTKSKLTVSADIQSILEHIDCDGDGYIEYTEFLSAALDKRAYMEEKNAWLAFSFFDEDKDGKISRKELVKFLGSKSQEQPAEGEGGDITASAGTRSYGTASMDGLMSSIDKNGDGHIDFQEFLAMLRQNEIKPDEVGGLWG